MNSGPTQQQNIQKLKKYFDKTPIFARPTSSIFLQSIIQNRLYNNHLQTTTTAYLKTNEKGLQTVKKHYKSIFFCIYRIVGSENKDKFIQYLLYKYAKKQNDRCSFPFVKYNAKKGVEQQLKDFMSQTLQISKIMGWNMKGFIESKDNIFVFVKLQSSLGEFSNQKNEKKRDDKLWWVLIDEICNHRKILNFPIDKMVTSLFLHNPLIIYLRDTEGRNKPIPRALFYGNAAQMIPFNFVFGPKQEDVNANYGPYYYLGSYKKAIRYGAWSPYYEKEKKRGELITDVNGKWDRGGIVRYAVYLGGGLKVLLNHPLDANTYTPEANFIHKILPFKAKIVDPLGMWARKYSSLYYGKIKIPDIKEGMWRAAPGWVTRDFNQQIPLTFHFIDKKTLGINWDYDNDNYYIE
jgi:hypothetical protein